MIKITINNSKYYLYSQLNRYSKFHNILKKFTLEECPKAVMTNNGWKISNSNVKNSELLIPSTLFDDKLESVCKGCEKHKQQIRTLELRMRILELKLELQQDLYALNSV